MTFTYTIVKTTWMGVHKVVYGTFTNGSGDTGGTIKTGLHIVYSFSMQQTGANVVADSPTINASFPSEGDIPIKTTDGADGIWCAVGL